MTHVFRRVIGRDLPRAASAHGAWIVDTEGRRYLDAAGGAIVVNVGHGDPALLAAMADQAKAVDYVHGTAFTTDALEAWGGATLLSERERGRFAGIERADSVVIDAHKQFYVPMGAGMVLFRDPSWTQEIVQHANYIVRKGSVDLGRHTLEGSRGAAAVMLYANLHLLGRKGLARLIDTGNFSRTSSHTLLG